MTDSNQTLKEVLSAISVEKAVKREVLTASANWSIRQLSQFFLKHGISGAPVVSQNNELLGVVTQSDIVRFESAPPDAETILSILQKHAGPQASVDKNNIEQVKAHANEYCVVDMIMTAKVFSVDCGTSLDSAYELIKSRDIHRLFVTRDGVLYGVMTSMDILNVVMEQMSDVYVSV